MYLQIRQLKYFFSEPGKMVHLLKWFPYKYKGLSLDTQDPRKNLGTVGQTYNPSTGEAVRSIPEAP